MTKTFASTNISYNICKKPDLTMKFDLFMDDYRSVILATDDIPKIRDYISFIWIYRRGLCTTNLYTTFISHNYKLQMCTDEAIVYMTVTE